MARIAVTGRCEPEIVAASSRQSDGTPMRYPPTISSAAAGTTTTSQSGRHQARGRPAPAAPSWPGLTWPGLAGPGLAWPGLAWSPEVAGSDRVPRTCRTPSRLTLGAEDQVAGPGGGLAVVER